MYCENTYKITGRDSSLPVSLLIVKEHLRLSTDNSCEDDYLKLLIETARDCFEGITRRVLISTSFKTYRNFWECYFQMEKSPMLEITSIEYYDIDGVLQTLSTDDYYVTDENIYSKIVFTDTMKNPTLRNRLQQIIINFKAGFGDTIDDIPSDVKSAMLAHIMAMYENRGDCEGSFCENLLPATTKIVYGKYRIINIAV